MTRIRSVGAAVVIALMLTLAACAAPSADTPAATGTFGAWGDFMEAEKAAQTETVAPATDAYTPDRTAKDNTGDPL